MKQFNIKDHIDPHIEELEGKDKISKKGKLNLSSNELKHSELGDFHHVFLSHINANTFSEYPYFPDYTDKIAEFLNLDREKIILTAGSDDAIKIIIEAFSKKTNTLYIQYPNYENYMYYASLRGMKCEKIGFHPGEKTINFTKKFIDILLTAKPSTVILTNPNGFTGEYLSNSELKIITETCQTHNHILIIDEAYTGFGYPSHSSFVEDYENVILVKTFSKSMGSAGLRIAKVYSSKTIIEYLKKWNGTNNVTSIALEYLLYSFNNKDIINKFIKEICDSRDNFLSIFKDKKGIKTYPSLSNFVCFKIEHAEVLAETFANNCIVFKNLSHIKGFEEHVRLTIGEKKIMNNVINLIKTHLNIEEELYEYY